MQIGRALARGLLREVRRRPAWRLTLDVSRSGPRALVLRPYQQTLVRRVESAFQHGARCVALQAATGAGKTAMSVTLLANEVAVGGTANFFAHLDSLVEDTHARLEQAGISAGLIQV